MSLRVMTLVGLLVLVLGVMMFWLAPATTSRPKSVKPMGMNAVSHGGGSSAGQARSPVDRPDSGDPREELYMQRK
jgi:hypothetical protein